jgi:anhydro-N-acetylmuramic acid kinase
MATLRDAFTPLGVKIVATDEMGVPSQAKEAVAFALLAWLRWHGLPGNVPSATGAARPVALGKVSLG